MPNSVMVPRLSPIFTEHSEASISFNLKLLLAAQGKLLVIRSNGPRVVQFRCAPWIAVKTGQLSKLMLQHLRLCVITTLSNRQAVLKCMVRHLNSLDISTMTLVHVIAGRTLVKELAKMEECSWDGIQGTLLFPAGDLKDTLLLYFVIFHNDSGIYIPEHSIELIWWNYRTPKIPIVILVSKIPVICQLNIAVSSGYPNFEP